MQYGLQQISKGGLARSCNQRTHTHARNVAVVVYQVPLARDQVQAQDMVVDFVGELVESSKSVDLVVANIRDRGIDKTGRLGAYCGDHLRLVAIRERAAAAHRAGRHGEGVVGGSAAARRGGEGGRLRRGRGGGEVGRGGDKSSSGCAYVCHELRRSVQSGKWVRIWGPRVQGQEQEQEQWSSHCL